MATKSSVSMGKRPSCWIAKWRDPTEMHAMCFGRTFIFVKKRSTRLMAVKRTSLGRSYQTLRHRSTCAAPSRAPIVISPSCLRQLRGKKNKTVSRLDKENVIGTLAFKSDWTRLMLISSTSPSCRWRQEKNHFKNNKYNSRLIVGVKINLADISVPMPRLREVAKTNP